MGKKLVITYGDVTVYDDVPATFNWSETENGTVEIKAGPGNTGPNWLETLMAAGKNAQQAQQTAESVEVQPVIESPSPNG